VCLHSAQCYRMAETPVTEWCLTLLSLCPGYGVLCEFVGGAVHQTTSNPDIGCEEVEGK
jgi:hypothetical protein